MSSEIERVRGASVLAHALISGLYECMSMGDLDFEVVVRQGIWKSCEHML